jgi:hypothetical protein
MPKFKTWHDTNFNVPLLAVLNIFEKLTEIYVPQGIFKNMTAKGCLFNKMYRLQMESDEFSSKV